MPPNEISTFMQCTLGYRVLGTCQVNRAKFILLQDFLNDFK